MEIEEALDIVLGLAADNKAARRTYPEEYARQTDALDMVHFARAHLGGASKTSKLLDALRPFADAGSVMNSPDLTDDDPVMLLFQPNGGQHAIEVGDFRRAWAECIAWTSRNLTVAHDMKGAEPKSPRIRRRALDLGGG